MVVGVWVVLHEEGMSNMVPCEGHVQVMQVEIPLEQEDI